MDQQPFENDYMRRVREQQAKAQAEESNPFRKLLNFLPGGSILDKATRSSAVPITGGDVAAEAALSLVPFGLGKAFKAVKGARSLSKGADILGRAPKTVTPRPGMLQKIGTSLEDKGQRLLGTQANLTRAEGRKIGALPSDVLGSINKRTGLTKLDDMAQVARGVTGSEGAFSELTRNAIGNIPGVDIGDLRKVGSEILENKAPLITGRQKDSLLASFKNSGVAARGGSAGSLSPLANPLDALDMSQNFRAMASDIKKSATVSAKDKQLASVYNDLAKHIENTLYKSPGIEEGLKLAAPDRARDLLAAAANAPTKAQSQAYKKLANEIGNIKDVKTLRSAQKDFVDLSKIDEATARAASGAGAQLGDQAQGLGKLVQRPTNIVALPLNAATPAVGGFMSKAGRMLQGTAPGGQGAIGRALSSPAAKFLLPQAGVRAGADILGIRSDTAAAGAPTGAQTQEELAGMGGIDAASLLGGQAEPSSMYSREAAAQDIQNDLQATGGENMEKYLKLYEFMNPQDTKKEKQASVKEFSQAQGGLSGVEQIAQMLQQNPNLLAQSTVPGQNLPIIGGLVSNLAGTGEYNALTNNVLNSLARLNTGASMPASEEAFYRRLLPAAGDSQETVQQKLAQLQQAFQPFTAGY